METFRVHILGCGSALPTLRHTASSQVVEHGEKMYMVDCGEGTQCQLRKLHLKFNRIGHVFISHMHGDHCFGLIGMISTFGILGRTVPLHLWLSAELRAILEREVEVFCTDLGYELVYHTICPEKEMLIYEDKGLTVTTIPLSHRVPCCGFLFREKPTLPHIRRDMVDFYGIPNWRLPAIKQGEPWVTEEGVIVPAEKLTLPPDPARSYAYCSDTRYLPDLHTHIRGVNLLYHESTYDSSATERAKQFFHSTAKEAAMVARDAEVGELLLGHFSARYNDETAILNEAAAVFPRVRLADEGMVIDVK